MLLHPQAGAQLRQHRPPAAAGHRRHPLRSTAIGLRSSIAGAAAVDAGSCSSSSSSSGNGSSGSSSSGNGSSGSSSSAHETHTCRRCRQRFAAADNTPSSCRYHPAMYSGGEVAKAVGFVRQSAAPEHQLQAVMGRRGLMRFWDCCGREEEAALGCCSGFHSTYDSALNEAMGWTSSAD